MDSVRHLMRWSEPVRVTRKRRRAYNDYTMNFLWDLSLVDYVTIDQAGWMYGAPRSTILHNLRHWRGRGLIQAAWVPYHGRRTRIIALAPGGAELLQYDDEKGWNLMHPHWVPVAERIRTNRFIEHNLDRNTVALTITRQAEDLRLEASWDLHITDFIISSRHPLHIKPDAAIRLNDHPWIIEVERSWRKETLLHKFAQYDRLILQGGWRHIPWCNEPPKVLFIPTETNTQKIHWETWMNTFQFHQHSYAWMWPFDYVINHQWTIYGGNGQRVIQPQNFWNLIRQPAYHEPK
ncbi:replication-relaxation family protein [Sulfobacillus thermosulfidooxidans]|uniref:replication-relaxation family protein n=1 Tax=Sulfobacillus thermosulfidooxidans TaxID=28034 RepID=UPI0006B64751|nr:replication-relaxation family protein [Sulfobacillus thermosulfidooxidans]